MNTLVPHLEEWKAIFKAMGIFNQSSVERLIILMAFYFYLNIARRIFMDDKAKAERNNYMKAWRKKNKDKVKAAQEKYWNKRSQALQKEA